MVKLLKANYGEKKKKKFYWFSSVIKFYFNKKKILKNFLGRGFGQVCSDFIYFNQ